jgi:hypothetical protein
MHWDDSESSVKPVGGIVDHFIRMDAGDTTTSWKVPPVKDGYVQSRPSPPSPSWDLEVDHHGSYADSISQHV